MEQYAVQNENQLQTIPKLIVSKTNVLQPSFNSMVQQKTQVNQTLRPFDAVWTTAQFNQVQVRLNVSYSNKTISAEPQLNLYIIWHQDTYIEMIASLQPN